jgi:hypothetical protein
MGTNSAGRKVLAIRSFSPHSPIRAIRDFLLLIGMVDDVVQTRPRRLAGTANA